MVEVWQLIVLPCVVERSVEVTNIATDFGAEMLGLLIGPSNIKCFGVEYKLFSFFLYLQQNKNCLVVFLYWGCGRAIFKQPPPTPAIATPQVEVMVLCFVI